MEKALNKIKIMALPLLILIAKVIWILFQGLLSLISIILTGDNDSDENADSSYEDTIVNHLTMEADYGLDPYGLYERDYK